MCGFTSLITGVTVVERNSVLLLGKALCLRRMHKDEPMSLCREHKTTRTKLQTLQALKDMGECVKQLDGDRYKAIKLYLEKNPEYQAFYCFQSK